jgi:hypothetical protein
MSRQAPSRRTVTRLAVLTGASCLIASTGGGPPSAVALASRGAAHTASAISLNDSGRLHLTSRHGFTLDEQGSASGSVSGPMYVHLTIVSTTRVVAEVNFYPRGGSISGRATASYRRGNSTASFSGTLSIARGTGSYAHVHGSGLSFSGTIRRSDEAIVVEVRGTASE